MGEVVRSLSRRIRRRGRRKRLLQPLRPHRTGFDASRLGAAIEDERGFGMRGHAEAFVYISAKALLACGFDRARPQSFGDSALN